MGRPSKDTVDYFPHYTASGKTLYTLESIYGNNGYAFWFKLLELLGGTGGHSYNYDSKPDWLYLLAKTNVDGETAENILSLLADLGAIDKELLQKKIIWSDNFTDGLRRVYSKRGAEIPLKPSFCAGNGVSAPETPQSKVKESKVKESKGKSPHGEFQNVYLTGDEYKKLQDKFPGDWKGRIESLSAYIKSKGKRYKDHYATILNWARMDSKKNPGANSDKSCANCDNEARGNCSDSHKAQYLTGGKTCCGGWREAAQ